MWARQYVVGACRLLSHMFSPSQLLLQEIAAANAPQPPTRHHFVSSTCHPSSNSIMQFMAWAAVGMCRALCAMGVCVCSVLPTNVDDGLVECILPSTALARVLAEHRSIHRYLAQFHPDPEGVPLLPRSPGWYLARRC